MAAPDDGGDAPKSTIQVLTPASQLAETTVIVFFKNNVFLLVNLNVQFPPGNDINVPSCRARQESDTYSILSTSLLIIRFASGI